MPDSLILAERIERSTRRKNYSVRLARSRDPSLAARGVPWAPEDRGLGKKVLVECPDTLRLRRRTRHVVFPRDGMAFALRMPGFTSNAVTVS